MNITNLNNAISQALGDTLDFMADACHENLEAERWDWPRTTIRENGSVVDSPRDVIDTGELYRSQAREKRTNEGSISYLADHAYDVHEGEEDKPARPWIVKTVEERGEEILETFANSLRSRLG